MIFLIEKAIQLVVEYYTKEDLDPYATNLTDFNAIPLAHTYYPNPKNLFIEVQVDLDLINPSIKTYINGKLKETIEVDSLENLIKDHLTDMNWESFVQVNYLIEEDENE